MAQESLRSGLGYVEGGIRYGYTDNTLWYLGETRMYFQGDPRNITILTYVQLRTQIDGWIAANPATRSTQPTSDETKCSIGFQGISIHTHDYYYQNYFFLGKADPTPYPTPSQLVSIFQSPTYGISGVGYGYVDPRQNVREGYTDFQFWYKGECRLFRVAALPANTVAIPTPPSGPPVGSGITYYRSNINNQVYVTGPAGDTFILLDYPILKQAVDDWEKTNPIQSNPLGDWFSSGFLFLGQRYWQSLGYQVIPDELALAFTDCERNLATVIKWLPGTRGSGSPMPSLGSHTVTLPSLTNTTGSTGLDGNSALLQTLLLSQALQGKKKKRKRKKGY